MSNNSRALNKKSMKDSKLSCVMFGQKHINSREGGIEVVVEELATRMVKKNLHVTCINRRGHHISGAEFDTQPLNEYKGIKILTVPTIKKRGLAALSSAFFASVRTAWGDYDIVHIHAEGPALFCWMEAIFCDPPTDRIPIFFLLIFLFLFFPANMTIHSYVFICGASPGKITFHSFLYGFRP